MLCLWLSMSRILSELLGVDRSLFAADIARLETASAGASADIQLTSEILVKVRQKTRELGLDPKDSTGREIYHALLNLTHLHDSFLVKKIGGQDSDDVIDLLPRLRRTALELSPVKTAWVMKHSVAKKMLKTMPPRRVMKYLGYKSVDSILKREPVAELFAAIQLLENDAWRQKFMQKYQTLTQMDFESRPIEIIPLDIKRWQEASTPYIKQNRHIILHVRELGVVIMLPPPFVRRSGISITVLPQLLHHLNEIRLYSAFYKLHQMQADFGQTVANSLLYDRGNHVEIAGHQVHWRVVQRHFGSKSSAEHPQVLEPHVQPDDLVWRKAEEVLFQLEPSLHFWHQTDYLGVFRQGRPLSFNLMDMALNYSNHIHYEQRIYGHLRDALWNELYLRYMGQPSLEYQVLRQLDYEATNPELLSMARQARSKT